MTARDDAVYDVYDISFIVMAVGAAVDLGTRDGLGRKPPILVRVRASPRSLGLAGVAPSEEGSLISMMKAFFALLFWRSHWGERVPVVKPVSPGQSVHKNNKKHFCCFVLSFSCCFVCFLVVLAAFAWSRVQGPLLQNGASIIRRRGYIPA